MCGRGYVGSSTTEIAEAASSASKHPCSWTQGGKTLDTEARHVLHPGCDIPVIFRDTTSRGNQEEDSTVNLITPMTFGLVPSFTKPSLRDGNKPNYFRYFNAKSETCSTVSVYSRLLKQNRCVVMFDGFFEWKDDWKKEKQPYFVCLKGRPMFLAGLYDIVTLEDGSELKSVTLLTTASCDDLSWLHDRMPVILNDTEGAIDTWLDVGSVEKASSSSSSSSSTFSLNTLTNILKPYTGGSLSWHPVAKHINKIGNSVDNASCIEPVVLGEPPKITSFFGISSTKKRTNNQSNDHSSGQTTSKKHADDTHDSSNKQTSAMVEEKTSRDNVITTNSKKIKTEDISSSEEGVACPQCTFINKKDSSISKCGVCDGELY